MKETKIGDYHFLKRIGKGGMGEVLLAYDPKCERQVAIKRIRPDLKNHSLMKNRFLKEAKFTAQLTHPGIISIYSIHDEADEIYYTMPYVQGKTLKQILHKAYQKKGTPGSIPSLLPIFKSICQTISYAHSKGILHRDLKPENILVGKFGEVIILDWGLAQQISDFQREEFTNEPEESKSLDTNPGKIVGTVAYMAPERALGAFATVQSDIYALGVILYQILTLRFPFHRSSIKEFCKTYHLEKLQDPEEIAPYRDVPLRLSKMVKKCLDPDPEKRYHNMEELIHDLMSHMEGRSEWYESACLNVNNKKHWEFQENVLISKHMAITRTTETASWVSIMVSRRAFAENMRLETRIQLGKNGGGIGFLLSVPEAAERENPLEGYCLWLGTEENPSSQLFRGTVEVMHLPHLFLKKETPHSITIEKIDNNIRFTLDGVHRFTFLSYIPLFGTHIGIVSHDADYKMEEITILVGSQNLQVSCLAVPDAFLAAKDFKRALAEYRRIGYSFPGHAEGREALFRAGITLLEQARTSKTGKKAENYYSLALEEFAKLHNTPGAPFEYLGKALVYQSLRDHSEEIKCLELGLRRYSKHPLVSAIREQLIYRMHEAAQLDRRSAYQLILIALRLLPAIVEREDTRRLFTYLIRHWEQLPFFECVIEPSSLGLEKEGNERKLNEIRFATSLAFWLAAPYILLELFEELLASNLFDPPSFGDIIYALFELGSFGLAHKLMKKVEDLRPDREFIETLNLLEPIFTTHQESLENGIELFFKIDHKDIGVREFRTISYLLQYALKTDQEEQVHRIAEKIVLLPLSKQDTIILDSYRIWAYLKEENIQAAEEIFEKYPYELLNQESTLLHSLYGCWLYLTEGEEIADIHFNGVIDTPFPRSWALLSHQLAKNIAAAPAWYTTSFLWERRQLYQQLTLFYQCTENSELETFYRHLEQEEYIYIPD